MKTLVPGYYILKKNKQGLVAGDYRGPFLAFKWALTFILTRAFINIALGPDEVKLQKPVHVMFLTDDRTEKGAVIINLLPARSTKAPRSYFDKMPLFASKMKRRQLSFNNPVHKNHIDSIIDEIGRLLEGKSTHHKCVNKKFAVEDLHIKGTERLDEQLAHYFREQVRQKFAKDFFERPRKLKLGFYTLETPDHAVLESVEVSSADESTKPMSERKFVIVCMARNQNYIYWLKDFYTSAKNIDCSVIGFNYRGIDYSKGMVWTQDSMINDVLAQAQRLLESGANPENIAFEGMSLGGAVATISAAKMHEKGLKVKLYNERSYRSLIRLMVGYVMPAGNSNPWNPGNWIRYLVVGLTYIFIAPIIWLVGWHLDAASAWARIPPVYKDYTVVRNHKNPELYDDDDLVHDNFSSIASLMAKHVDEIKLKQKEGVSISLDEQQLLTDRADSHEFTLDRSNLANTNPSSHSAPRRFLVDTHTGSKTMHAYMIEHLRLKLGIFPSVREPSNDPGAGQNYSTSNSA